MAETPQRKLGRGTGLNLSFGGKVNARRPGLVTAIELDGPIVRIAQAAPRGSGVAVVRVGAAPLGLSADDADLSDPTVVGQALAKSLESMRVRTGAVVLGVPRTAVVLRTLALPATNNLRELASMVHMQIGKDLPFRLEEAVIDFTVRPSFRKAAASDANEARPAASLAAPLETSTVAAKTEVLVAAVRRDKVNFYELLAQAAGLKLIALGWLSQGNARCLEACQLADGDEAVALISVRPGEVGIDIVAKSALLFSRGAALHILSAPAPGGVGAADEKSAREASSGEVKPGLAAKTLAEAIAIEVVRSLHSYGGMEPQAPVKRLVVVGASGQEAAVQQVLQERLQLPCSVLNPGSALELPSDEREHAAGAMGAMGLGLGVNDALGLPFDFLTPKRPAVQRNMRQIRNLALTAVGVILFLGFLGFRSHLINQRLKINRQLQAELTTAEKNRPKYRQMQIQAAAVQGWQKDGRNWLEHYAYLSAVLPPSDDLYLTSLTVSGQGIIHMAVQARSGEILANLDRQLRAAGYDVKPLAINPGTDRFGYNFRSTVELIVPPKLGFDLSKTAVPSRPADDGSLDGKAGRKGGRS